MIPSNPFDPDSPCVPDVLRRLFAAVDDVQREYFGSSREAQQSLANACSECQSVLLEIQGDERPIPPARDSLIPVVLVLEAVS